MGKRQHIHNWIAGKLQAAHESARDSFIGQLVENKWVHSNPAAWQLLQAGENEVFFEPNFPIRDRKKRAVAELGADMPSLGFERLQLKARNWGGVTSCKAWYKQAKEGFPTIVYCHGNAGDLEARKRIFLEYTERGFGLIAVAYPGFNGSRKKGFFGVDQRPSEKGCVSGAHAAVHFLQKAGVPTESMVLVGESLGSAIALQVARKIEETPSGFSDQESESKLAGIVCAAGFASFPLRVRETLPYFPAKQMMRNQFDSLQHVTHVKTKPLFIHGLNDETTGPHHSVALAMASAGHYREAKQMMEKLCPEIGKARNTGKSPAHLLEMSKQACNKAISSQLLEQESLLLYDNTSHHFSELKGSYIPSRRKIKDLGDAVEAYLLARDPVRWSVLKEPAADRKERFRARLDHTKYHRVSATSILDDTIEHLRMAETQTDFRARLAAGTGVEDELFRQVGQAR